MSERDDLKPIKAKSGPQLAIQLDEGPTSFLPGDTITGIVSREEPIVAPHGTVEIALKGVSVVHYFKTRNVGSSTVTYHYYSEVILFDEKQTLFDGPLHIAADHDILPSAAANTTNIWPFSFTIPTHASPTTSNLHLKHPSRSFFPIDAISLPQTLATTPIPASFYFPPDTEYDRIEAWINYYLEATLTEEHVGTSFLTGHAKTDSKVKHARLPITVTHSPAPPVHDFRILRHVVPNQSVSSPRLLPGRGKDSKLSMHEHLSKFFKSSSVPKFGFAVEMEFPTLLQLGNDLPLGIRILPDGPGGEHTSEVIKGIEQTVTLEALKFRIIERVDGKLDVEKYSGHEENYVKDGKLYYHLEFSEGSKWEKDGQGALIVPCFGGSAGRREDSQGGAEDGGLTGEKSDEKKEHRHRLSWGGKSRPSTSSRKSISKEEEAGFGHNALTATTTGSTRRYSSDLEYDEKVPAYSYHPNNESSSSSGSNQGPFLQLGQKLRLRLDKDKIQDLGFRDEEPGAWDHKRHAWKWSLAPSFTTFNMSVKYLLKVEITLGIAGEKVKVSAQHGVNLVQGWS
ncbi:hypothetical protein V8F20_010941 [Naviculisporaceae sp. PSN 640]